MNIKHRQTCRICGNSNFAPVISLGNQFLQGAFYHKSKPNPSYRRIPNDLVRCDISKNENACGLVQTKHTIPPEIMYSNYWYQSGISKTMREHLREITQKALSFFPNAKTLSTLDIACNDGTLLKNYPDNVTKYGIDPSDISGKINEKDLTIINDFFPSNKVSNNLFDIITSIAMFYDLDDPKLFVKQISELLKLDGVWGVEMAYLPYILENLCYDTIVSEHIEHYHLAPLEYLFNLYNLELIDVYLNDTNGGSIQCWVAHKGVRTITPEAKERIFNLRKREFDMELDTDYPYEKFQEEVRNQTKELLCLIKNILKEGKTIHLYGASTKANTLLQTCQIDSTMIRYAAERSPEKFGAETLSGIKIISEEESRKMKPDYYLVGPWHFKKEILEREKDLIMSGVKFIFPLPKVEVIGD